MNDNFRNQVRLFLLHFSVQNIGTQRCPDVEQLNEPCLNYSLKFNIFKSSSSARQSFDKSDKYSYRNTLKVKPIL